MVKDYSNEWDSEQDNWRRQDVISDYGWFEAGQVCHTPMDFVYLPEEGSERTVTVEDLLQYDVLVYPHPTILTKPRGRFAAPVRRTGRHADSRCAHRV